MKSSRQKTGLIFAAAVVTGALYWLLKNVHPFGIEAWMVKGKLLQLFWEPVAGLFQNMILTSAFWIVLGLTLTLERIIPAKPNQKILSYSFAQDLVWFFYETILHGLVILTYVAFLNNIYQHHFNFLTITAISNWPDWVRFLVGLLILDFMYWLQHYVNHKVPVLWCFHTVHHSQKALNFFTDFRYHVLEYLIRHTFLVIPFLFLQVDPPTIVSFGIFHQWYSRFYHGNLKLNLGPLCYILVTPQSHRIHHSIESSHRDKNFGSLFSIWDYIFGTQYRGYDEYPNTGIEDDLFPHERTAGIKNLLLTPLVQLVYPFEMIKGKFARRKSLAGAP